MATTVRCNAMQVNQFFSFTNASAFLTLPPLYNMILHLVRVKVVSKFRLIQKVSGSSPDWVCCGEDEEAGRAPLLQNNRTLLPLWHPALSRL